ncbi:MAG: BtrH N-terminal domain-containing protein [Deltaproteobacteria bacterium]|nr:BtrH N-terminal domain-containing protein [Deltaproteobacteria bacterium]
MRYVIPGFEHVPGVSCGPTSVRDVLAARGLNLTEAMVFGLGSGLGFYLFRSETGLSRSFVGRTLTMEHEVCELLGLSWVEHREPDAARAWQLVKARADSGVPVVLTTDIKFLPYYDTQTSYNGHRVVLAGHDLERDLAFVADTERPGLIDVALPDLARARGSEAFMAGHHDHSWFEIEGELPKDVASLVPEAVRRAGVRILEDPSGFGGVAALDDFARDLADWPKLHDFAKCAKEGFLAIEKRGTGGGCFRALFAQFLDEAQRLQPNLPLAPIAHAYRELAWQWGELATAMRLASQDGAWDGVPAHATGIAERERELAEKLAKLS